MIYNVQNAGNTQLANWAEKTVKVKAGEKNNGLLEKSGGAAGAGVIGTPLQSNKPTICKMVTLEAESQTEAAEAVRSFYGPGIVNNLFAVALSSNLSETKPQV